MTYRHYAIGLADRKWLEGLLLEMILIDNTTKPDVDLIKRNEDEIFKIIEREVRVWCSCLKPEVYRVPIDSRLISSHQYLAHVYYTKNPERPNGLSIEETYASRSNLVIVMNGTGGVSPDSPTICSHVDTVAPYLRNIKAETGIVYGRGACDDKGSIVSIVEAMRLISEAGEKEGINPLYRSVITHFVIDEESGGNGALSLSLSEKWTSNNVLVAEITDLIPHRANRGALWYKIDLTKTDPCVNSLMTIAYIVLSLEAEGDMILEETTEGIFLKDHVQTSQGIIAVPAIGKRPTVTFGLHPSTVNGYVKFTITTKIDPMSLHEVIEESIRKYVAKYGDKTSEKDPETGLPKVPRHFGIANRTQGNKTIYDIEIFGKTGHMGAFKQCDCAIIKMAYVLMGLKELVNKKRIKMNIILTGAEDPSRRLVLEGGQGFTASHNLNDIQCRIITAVDKGVKNYLSTMGIANSIKVETSFDKLHNDAYESLEGSASWNAILDACRIIGIRLSGEEERAWGSSCDARLYAKALRMVDPSKSARNVITFGAGSLKYAHSQAEQVSISDVLLAGSAIALWAMKLSRA